MHCFISYSHVDKELANTIVNILKKYGVASFLDEKDINYGETIERKVEEAINISTHIVVIISPASLKSTWVPYELGIARGKDVTILPLLTHPSLTTPEYIRKIKHFINLKGFENFVKKIRESELEKLDEYFKSQQEAKNDHISNLMNLLGAYCAGRLGQPLFLIFIDLDNFNGINKKFGSKVADDITQGLLKYLENKFKANLVRRFAASDEFIICLDKISLDECIKLAESVRKHIRNCDWSKISPDLYVTGSFGVAELNKQEQIKSWILRSIYGKNISKMKKNGNAVTIAPHSLPKHFSKNIARHLS